VFANAQGDDSVWFRPEWEIEGQATVWRKVGKVGGLAGMA